MLLGADDGALRRGNIVHAILRTVALHDVVQVARLAEHAAARLLGDEQNVHIGKNRSDGVVGLLLAPKVGAIVDVKGNLCAARLEALDHLQRNGTGVLRKRQRDAAGVEHARAGVDGIGNFVNGDGVDRRITTVVDDGGLAGRSAAFVVINAQARCRRGIVDQIVVRYTLEADMVLDVGAQFVIGELGDDAGAQSQQGHARGDVQFGTARAFVKHFAAYDAFVGRGGKSQHDLPEGDHVKIFFCHSVKSLLLRNYVPAGTF